ncbi:MAG TPA: PVC-type heme-binding CxxCH protein [Luteitalea sp.]|nr:PVC-type heme-binding CxxCH protein [Luteitalea sp.]
MNAVRTMIAAAIVTAAGAGSIAAQEIRPEPNKGGALDLESQDPKIALQRLKIADGYEISLFASEVEFPDLAKPLFMTFDGRGRLWVLTSPTYPHVKPDEKPADKLIVLEDTNHDGKADKSSVFADGLYIPTGFAIGDGGVYIAQQPNLVFLKDTDGDGKADSRRILLHGFGTEDSHHSIHAWTWGPDGALYFQEGTFLHSQVETPYGPRRLAYAGVWRYEPRTEKLDVFVSYPFANPWGHVIDRWGQNFVSDASNGYNYWGTAFSGHVNYPQKQRSMQEWTLTRVRPTSGSEFVSSRHFPDSAQGNFLYNNTIGFQGIKQFKTVEEGSGFVGIEVEPLLQSTDPNFRPVGMQFGPDGALYVIDWFNPLIGHMQYSLRDPRRDKTRGRVWRITAKGRPLLQAPKIDGATLAQQLDLLKAYEDRTRYQARLALRERPLKEVLPAIETWTANLDRADKDYEHHLLETLWVQESHDHVNTALLEQLLKAKEFRARAAAVRVLQHWFDRVPKAMALLGAAVKDDAPRVRLEAVRALSFVPTTASAELALQVLDKPMDYYLQYVLDSTMTTLEPVWKPALTTGGTFGAGNARGLAFVLDRISPEDLAKVKRSTPVYHALLSRAGVPSAARREALEALATQNGSSVAKEIVSAVERTDGAPGSGGVSSELMQLLAGSPAASIQAERSAIEGLARDAKTDSVREGAFAALMQADGVADRAWAIATTPRQRIDLLRAAAKLPVGPALESVRSVLAPTLAAAVTGAVTAQPAPAIAGRYVRLVRPGRGVVLSVTEVEVKSGGQNIAKAGKASQSTIVAGGATGGHAARAIDAGVDMSAVAGTDPLNGTHAFTSPETDPWWELDLGAEKPIESVALWPAAPETRNGYYVAILDANRKVVFVRDGLRLAAAPETIALGGDLAVPLNTAAIALLPQFKGHEAESVQALSAFMRQPAYRQASMAAIRRLPPNAVPASDVAAIGEQVLTHVRAIPPADRTGRAFLDAVGFGHELSARMPAGERDTFTRSLDELVVRVIRIEAVNAQMKFDLSRFTVMAGEEVVIEFVNRDEMPHNLLVAKEGALETVGLAAEAMVSSPDAFGKSFIPNTPEVLFSMRLIQPNETLQARFTAPKQPGAYPFVCTFPGHWRTMNGIVEVTRPPAQVSAQ